MLETGKTAKLREQREIRSASSGLVNSLRGRGHLSVLSHCLTVHKVANYVVIRTLNSSKELRNFRKQPRESTKLSTMSTSSSLSQRIDNLITFVESLDLTPKSTLHTSKKSSTESEKSSKKTGNLLSAANLPPNNLLHRHSTNHHQMTHA